MILHPLHASGIGFGYHRTVGHHALWNALSALLARGHRGDTRDDGAAVDAARWITDGREHAAFAHRLDRRRHSVDPADQDVGAVARLHDVVGGERHVVIVEEGGVDLRVFGEIGLPQARGLGDVPVGRLGVEHLDTRILLDHGVEALGAALRTGVAERALRHDYLALAMDEIGRAHV